MIEDKKDYIFLIAVIRYRVELRLDTIRIKDITGAYLEPAVPAIGEDNFRLCMRTNF